MFLTPPASLAVLGISAIAMYCAFTWIFSRQNMPLPPGPTRLPIIGNHLQLPESKPWEKYSQWKRIYGDVVYLKDWGRDIIILNSFQAVYDLLERKSAIYSGRPQFIMFHELMDFGKLTAFLPYGETWRKHRTMFAKQMHPHVIDQFHSLQILAIRRLLNMLFKSPDKFADHIRHMPASIVMAFTYGYEIQEEDDPYVRMAGANSRAFARAIIPGAFLVDNIPLLKYLPSWFPGAGFQKVAASSRSTIKATRDALFEMVMTDLQNGKSRPSFVGNCLMDSDISTEKPDEIDILKNVAVGMFGAGTTTTSATIMYFVLAMVLYPDVLNKAHAELDEVVGRGRLPEFHDRERLPYINAIVKETFRWFPVAPTGIPHATTEEDSYEGYRIPAGSTIIPNTWEILHDEKTYPQPYSFCPERFIPDQAGHVQKDPTLLGSFGFGRRVCAGKNLAEATIWLTISNILALFTIEHAVDSAAQKIDISYALQADGHSLCIPKPFPCRFSPRDSQAEKALLNVAIQQKVTA